MLIVVTDCVWQVSLGVAVCRLISESGEIKTNPEKGLFTGLPDSSTHSTVLGKEYSTSVLSLLVGRLLIFVATVNARLLVFKMTMELGN